MTSVKSYKSLLSYRTKPASSLKHRSSQHLWRGKTACLGFWINWFNGERQKSSQLQVPNVALAEAGMKHMNKKNKKIKKCQTLYFACGLLTAERFAYSVVPVKESKQYKKLKLFLLLLTLFRFTSQLSATRLCKKCLIRVLFTNKYHCKFPESSYSIQKKRNHFITSYSLSDTVPKTLKLFFFKYES